MHLHLGGCQFKDTIIMLVPLIAIVCINSLQIDYTISVSVDLISLLNEGEGDPMFTRLHNNQDYNRNGTMELQ